MHFKRRNNKERTKDRKERKKEEKKKKRKKNIELYNFFISLHSIIFCNNIFVPYEN